MEGEETRSADSTGSGGASIEPPREPPRNLGRYSIDHVLGTGSMGIVLAARDPELDRAVALKLMHRGEADAQRRLLREAQAMARLRHPNVVTVHDVGECDGRVFVAMELIAGITLRAWLRQTPRRWREVIELFLDAGRGLIAAHAAGIVHRDFKPDNVLVGDDGGVRVADFGLASTESDGRSGAFSGTPAYMAPEQHDGASIGPAADQYAFAASLWEALSGTRPFLGGSRDALAAAKRANCLEPTTGAAPRWAFALLRRALSPAPADRFPSMAALVSALERGLHRRRRAVAAGVAVVALTAAAAAAVAVTGPATGPSCGLAAADVERVWNPTAREVIRGAFAANQRPHAAATLGRVLSALDHQAGRLGAARVAACEATHLRGEQSQAALDRRMACIDQRLDAMKALVTLFGRGVDDDIADHAYEAVIALPDADGCARATVATAGEPPAPIRDAVAAARTRLAEANALRAGGKFADAVTTFVALVEEARRLAYPPLTAEVLSGRAHSIEEQSDAAAGDRAYREAAAAAAAAADDRLIADAWIGQLGLLSGEGGKPADALGHLSFAEVAVTRAGDDALREDFLVARSDVYDELGRYGEARADLEAARASVEARGAGATPHAGRVLSRLATMLYKMGENRAAIDLDRRVLALLSDALGPDHPKVSIVINNFAMHLDEAGDYDQARDLLDRSLSIKERTYGRDHPSVAMALANLGMVTHHLGHAREAATFNERALAIREKTLGPDHPTVATTLSNLANNLHYLGRNDEALVLHRRALAIREKALGPEHPSLAFTLNSMGSVLLDLGRGDQALASMRRALAIRAKALGANHPLFADELSLVGEVCRKTHRQREACAAFDRAVSILDAVDAEHPRIVRALVGRAACRVDRGDARGAIADTDRAITLASRIHGSPWHIGWVRFVQAQALWLRAADRHRSIELAHTARATYEGAPAGFRTEVDEIDAWLKSHRVR